jgi:hypothetical protein
VQETLRDSFKIQEKKDSTLCGLEIFFVCATSEKPQRTVHAKAQREKIRRKEVDAFLLLSFGIAS